MPVFCVLGWGALGTLEGCFCTEALVMQGWRQMAQAPSQACLRACRRQWSRLWPQCQHCSLCGLPVRKTEPLADTSGKAHEHAMPWHKP